MGLHPVNRIKHVVDASGTIAAPAVNTVAVVIAVDAPVIGNTSEVVTGSKVNAIYLKVEMGSNEQILGLTPNFYLMVAKNPGNNLTLPSPNAVGANDNKRFVIHQEMIMFDNVQGGNPRVVFNGVIVIPKGYRRMGPNDRLTVSLLAPQINTHFCLQAHYKEFR